MSDQEIMKLYEVSSEINDTKLIHVFWISDQPYKLWKKSFKFIMNILYYEYCTEVENIKSIIIENGSD